MSFTPATPASAPLPSNTFAGPAEPLFIQAGGGGGATVLGNTQINGTLDVTGLTSLTTAAATGFFRAPQLIVSSKTSSTQAPTVINAAPGLTTIGVSGNFKCLNLQANFFVIPTLNSAVITISNAAVQASVTNPAPVQLVGSTFCDIPGMTLTAINAVAPGVFDYVFTPIAPVLSVASFKIGLTLLVV